MPSGGAGRAPYRAPARTASARRRPPPRNGPAPPGPRRCPVPHQGAGARRRTPPGRWPSAGLLRQGGLDGLGALPHGGPGFGRPVVHQPVEVVPGDGVAVVGEARVLGPWQVEGMAEAVRPQAPSSGGRRPARPRGPCRPAGARPAASARRRTSCPAGRASSRPGPRPNRRRPASRRRTTRPGRRPRRARRAAVEPVPAAAAAGAVGPVAGRAAVAGAAGSARITGPVVRRGGGWAEAPTSRPDRTGRGDPRRLGGADVPGRKGCVVETPAVDDYLPIVLLLVVGFCSPACPSSPRVSSPRASARPRPRRRPYECGIVP